MSRGLARRSLAAVGLAVTLALGIPRPSALLAGAGAYPLPVQIRFAPVDEHLEDVVLNLINEERVAVGLVPLMPHATIQRAARAYGRELFARGYLSHVSESGLGPRDRVLALGVRVRLVGENLAYASDVGTAHAALLGSEDHRRNILFPDYRLIGVAVVDGGPDGVILVEDFSDEGTAYPLPRWWEPP
jgi:uncharacterized protein YkwD